MKHTKGPWKLVDPEVGGCREIAADNAVGLPCICNTVGLEDDDEDAANAYLIAAAPELLEALKQLNIVIQAGGDFMMGLKGRHSTLKDSLNKLIAKAEGK